MSNYQNEIKELKNEIISITGRFEMTTRLLD